MKQQLSPFLKWLVPLGFVALSVFFYTAVRGYSFSGLICLALAGLISCYDLLSVLKKRHFGAAKVLCTALNVIVSLGLIVVIVTGSFIVDAAQGAEENDCEYVVILGCRVYDDGPSLSLQDRIRAAYDYLTAHPDSICIVTGGQGEDEPMTEARCLYDRLTALGIDGERIWLEEAATSTWENLNFSLDLIEEKTGTRPETIGLLSSEYHLFRASLFAKDCGVTAIGIPAKTSRVSLRINNYLREIAGVWHYIILGG